MKQARIESLVSWMWTGAVLIGVGFFFLIRGWFFSNLGIPLWQRRVVVDPQIALGGGILLLVIGLALVVVAVIGKLRSER